MTPLGTPLLNIMSFMTSKDASSQITIFYLTFWYFSQLYYDGYGPYASLLEQTALNTNRAIGPSDRLKTMLSMCAHTVREVDSYFENPAQNQQCKCMHV